MMEPFASVGSCNADCPFLNTASYNSWHARGPSGWVTESWPAELNAELQAAGLSGDGLPAAMDMAAMNADSWTMGCWPPG